MTIDLRKKCRLVTFLLLLAMAVASRAQAQLAITSCPDVNTVVSLGGVDGIGLAATGGSGPTYTWTLALGSSPLPPGLSIRTDLPQSITDPTVTAVIAGVAITPGLWNFTLQVSNGADVATRDCAIKVSSLVVKDTALPNAFVGQQYPYTLTALQSGAVVFPTWTATGLPAGMSFNNSTGEIGGAPLASGVFPVRLSATLGVETVTVTRTINVFDLRIATQGSVPGYLPNATQNVFYSTQLSASGGSGLYTFAHNGLPPGLGLIGDTISGTPLQPGIYQFNVTATDSNQTSYVRPVVLQVLGVAQSLPLIAPYQNGFDDCAWGTPCSRGVSIVAGGKAPFHWTASGLPAGMSIRDASAPDATPNYSPKDGEIWGVSTQLGTYNVIVTVTDADGKTATNTFPLKVSELLMVNSPNTQWTRGVFGQQRLRILGGPSKPDPGQPAPNGTIYTAALLDGAPPVGVGLGTAAPALCAASVDFCGTPTENIGTVTKLRFTATNGTQLDTSYFFNVASNGSTITIGTNSNLGTIPSGTGYSRTLFACCTPNPLNWTIVSGTLPTGVSLQSNGVLAGSPVNTGTFTFLVQATDSGDPANFGRRQFTLGVVANAFTTSTMLPPGTVGSLYNFTLTTFSGGAVWSVNPYNYLPPGLTLSAAGVLSGTPLQSGQYSFSVTANAGVNGVLLGTFNIAIYPAGVDPPITFPLSNQSFSLGSVTLALSGAAGGSGTGYHYSYTPGADPVPGLRVQDGTPLPIVSFSGTATAGLLGVATTPGVFSTSIRVTDSHGNFFDRPFIVTIRELQILSPTTLPKATRGLSYSYTLAPYGGVGAYSWSATGLNSGLTIDSTTGTISTGAGTITGSGTSTVSAVVTLTDSSKPVGDAARSVTQTYTIVVNAFAITTGGVLPVGKVGDAYNDVQLAAANCTAPCTWTIVGTPPTGWAISTAGVFGSTFADHKPTATVNTSFSIQASSPTGGTVTKIFALQVVPASPQIVQITTSPTVAATYLSLGSAMATQLAATGGAPPYTWNIDSASAPSNVTLAPGEVIPGVSLGLGQVVGDLAPGFTYLYGRPMKPGVYTFTLRATDNNGLFATRTFSYEVVALAVAANYSRLPPNTSNNGTITAGVPFSSRILVLGGSATQGLGDYTWLNTTPLPYALSLDPFTGVVSGTPTEASTATYPIQVTDNGSGAKLIFNLTLNVVDPNTGGLVIGMAATATFQQGAAVSRNLTLSGGTAPYTVTAVTPLPPGLTLLSGDSLIPPNVSPAVFLSGVFLQPGVYTFTLRAQDSAAPTPHFVLKSFMFLVTRATFGGQTSLPDGSLGERYSHKLITWDNGGTANWSVTPGFSLPLGLHLGTGGGDPDCAVGTLCGTPLMASTNFNFSLDMTDPADPTGGVVTVSFSLRVSSIRITDPPTQVVPVAAVVGSPFQYQFVATGGAVQWSLGGGLPGVWGFDPDTGVLQTLQNPTGQGTFAFNVTATPVGGGVPVTRRFVLYIRFPNRSVLDFSLASTQLADVTVGQAFTTVLSPTGGAPPYSFSVAPGHSLPPGFFLVTAPSLGLPIPTNYTAEATSLAGAAAVAGNYTFDLIIQDSLGATIRRTFTLRVSPIGIVTTGTPNITVGTVVSQRFTPFGGAGPYTLSISPVNPVQDMLPPGLSFGLPNCASDQLCGTTTSTGFYIFFLKATDANGATFTRRTQINVVGTKGLLVSNTNPPDASLGAGRRSVTLTVTNPVNANFNPFSTTFTWSVAPGSSLPPGLSLINGDPWLDNNTWMLAGQPTTVGTFTFTLRITDNNPNSAANVGSADHTFTYRVASMQVVSPPTEALVAPDLPPAQVGVPYTPFQLRVSGGTAPYFFVQSPFTPLPTGMTLSADGVLSGTPTSTGLAVIAPVITDSSVPPQVLNAPGVVLVVTAQGTAPALNPLTTAEVSEASVGVPYSFPLDTLIRGGTAPFTWSVVQLPTWNGVPTAPLPDGLVLLPGSNGVSTYVSGVPTTAFGQGQGGQVFLEVHDAGGQSLTVPLDMDVSPLAMTPDTLPPAIVGVPYSATLTPSGGMAPYTFLLYPLLDLPPGLTLESNGLLHGTPTTAGNFAAGIAVVDNSADLFVGRLYRFVVDNAAGESPAVSLAPTPIQIFYTIGSPNPAPIPISVNVTHATFPQGSPIPFGLSIAGIPGATLSTTSGTLPDVSNLTLDLSGVDFSGVTLPVTYHGVLGVRAQTANLLDHVPVTLTVAAAPPCTYSVNPMSSSVAATGGSGSFGVLAGPGCEWTAAPDSPWISITSAAIGSGPAPVDFSVQPNPGLDPRTGIIDVHGQAYSITQFGAGCSFAISPTSLSAPAAGGTAVVNITASNAACAWTAPDLSASPPSGTGSGSVLITVPPTASPTGIVLNATIAGQPFIVNQGGVGCSVGLSPLEASSPAAGGIGSVTVTPSPGCSYDTIIGPGWVTITSGAASSAPGTLVYQVQPNSTTFARSGSLTIGGQSFLITQEGVACSVTVDTSALGSPYGPAKATLAGTIGVTANGPNCTWVAGSGAIWATLSKSAGTGSDFINVGVTSNASVTTPRTTDLTVAGQTISITQVGTTCSYALQSATASLPAPGGLGTVGVISPNACAWTATSNTPAWLTIVSSGTTGTSNVLFSALPNGDPPNSPPRVGTLTIAGKTYTVTQAAPDCTYGLPTASATAGFPATPSATFGFTAAAGCTPTPVSYVDWLSVVSVGAGTVEYSVLENPNPTQRVGTIQVGNKTFTVTQAAAVCAFRLTSYGSTFAQSGGPGSFGAAASNAACPTPTPGRDQNFIQLLPLLPGSPGLFSIPFTIDPYNSLNVSVRFGKVTFGGQVHSIKQTSW